MTGAEMTMNGYRFGHVVRMEWIKLRSLRSTTAVLALLVVALVAVGVLAGHNTKNVDGDPTSNVLAGVLLGQIVMGALGALVITGEYATGMLAPTLCAAPARGRVLAAKALVFGIVALVVGEVASFAAFLVGTAGLARSIPRPTLSQPDVLRAVVLSGAYLALIGLVGLGLGVIVRHTATAIGVFVGGVFVLPLLGLGRAAGPFLPEMIAGNSLAAVKPVRGFTFSPWLELGIVAGYALIALSVGGWLLNRRDA